MCLRLLTASDSLLYPKLDGEPKPRKKALSVACSYRPLSNIIGGDPLAGVRFPAGGLHNHQLSLGSVGMPGLVRTNRISLAQ